MSSSPVAIRVDCLGKRYEIYDTPRDRLRQFLFPTMRRFLGLSVSDYFHEFWALRDLSLEIRKGQTVGIIGGNGSGKSTLLQIICGTLSPSVGDVESFGRIAALLELGSGFNPEFTGRENVFMNASLLGLAHAEIVERLDAIIAFAGVGEFIDQPVKTYSSGMYVRLAFAVIAHVDADILIVDEALAVGDAVFTQRCMRFIRQFQLNGTLLFVSHDLAAVQALCESAIWLKEGRVERVGSSSDVVEAYLQYTQQQIYGDRATIEAVAASPSADDDVTQIRAPVIDYGANIALSPNLDMARGWRSGGAEILSIEALNLGEGTSSFRGWERVRLRIRARSHQRLERPIIGFIVKDRLGQDLFGENTLSARASRSDAVEAGREFSADFVFRLPMLQNGDYAVMASVADGDLHDNVQHHFLHDACILHVSSSQVRWGLVGVAFEQITLFVADD